MFTIILAVVITLISIAAFNNEALYDKLILWPRKMHNPAEYYRLLTSGFIHADWNHLLFNMFTLYSFGRVVEAWGVGITLIILFCTGVIVASLPSFLKNRQNNHYRSLGASGGVASVLFFSIYFTPWSSLNFFFIPIDIPAIVFAGLYLVYSAYMSRRGGSGINHDAHFWGSVYGVLFALLVDPTHGASFVNAIMRRG